MGLHHDETHRPAFSAWLLRHSATDGTLGELVKAAKGDRAFPREGDADAVRKRLNEVQAPGEMFDAVDDAELDWAAY